MVSIEVLTQAIIAFETGYVSKDEFQKIETQCQAISGMLMKLIQARKK